MLPIAHNGYAAWGITAGMTDQADLFIEEIGDDGASVREGDDMVPGEVIDERIEVRGGEAVTERVLMTRRGPIVSPFLDGAPAALSLSAVWLRPLPIRGFLACLRARDFDTFRRGFAAWPGPALNVVYADAGGHIGYQLVGQLPKRRRGHGTLPLPGWLEGVGWEDEHVPFDEMPSLDPAIGFVASANNRPAADGDGPYLGMDWMDGYRQARIVEELARRHDLGRRRMRGPAARRDQRPLAQAAGLVLELPVSDPDGQMALALLRGWNGQVTVDSAAASVFALWLAEMARRIARAKAPASWRYALGYGFGEIVPLTTFHSGSVAQTTERLCEQPDGWFARGWPLEAADALASAMRRLRTEHGPDPAGWGWGRRRTLTLRHPAGDRALTADAFNLGPVPMPGDGTTPLQAASGPLDPLRQPRLRAEHPRRDRSGRSGGRSLGAGRRPIGNRCRRTTGTCSPSGRAARRSPSPGRKRRSRRPRSRRCSSSRPASPLRRRAAAFAARSFR